MDNTRCATLNGRLCYLALLFSLRAAVNCARERAGFSADNLLCRQISAQVLDRLAFLDRAGFAASRRKLKQHAA